MGAGRTHAATRSLPASKGLIQRVLPERGYGFIRCTHGEDGDIGTDFFFHRDDLDDVHITELREGLLVEFNATHPPKGPRAEHIRADV